MIATASFNFILLLLYAKNTFGQNGNVEFVVDDQELLYIEQNLTWNEASSLCRSFKSSLITIKELSFASHVLEALAAFKAQELVWIGGRIIHDQWMWKVSGLPIQIQGDNFSFPVLNGDKSNLTNYQCLAVSTQNFLYPTFISINCREEKGLLCQKAQQQPTLLVEEFNYNNHNYSIYEGQSTWQTAVGMCNKHNMYLTALSDVTELQEVALTLASYTHLDINVVWVGALKDFDSWQWVSTGDQVEHIIQGDTKLSKCLALNIKTQLFYAENCSNGRGFVCESRHPDDDFWESFVHQSTEYTIHSLKTTWEKANKICQIDNSYLATVEDLPDANVIAINMGNAWEALTSAWLGAKTVQVKSNLVFKWQDSGKELPLKVDENGYPPWKNTTFELNQNMCLTLERSRDNGAYFLNSLCDDARGFICQRDASVPLAMTFTFRNGDKDLLFHDKPETWMKAQEVCELAYSRLLIVSDPDELSSVKQFTTRHKLWLDGTYENNKWHWKHDSSELPSEGNILLPHLNKHNATKKCFSIYLQKSRPKFVASSCKTKLPYICERNTQKEQLIKYKGSEYTVINKHLTWYEALAVCQARDQNLAETCDTNEAEFLAKLTTAYGDLWLGGIKRETKWIWDAVNETLSTKIDSKIGYPPWLHGRATREGVSCLTLTVNPSSQAAFTDTSCREVKSFICEKYSVQSHKHKFLQPRVSVLDNRQYMFYPQLSTWKDANEECSDNLAFLAIASTPQIARHIANLTYGHPEIWIGGILDENTWKWSINGENIKSWGENETQWANENEILDEELSVKGKYLALNRLNPNIPLFVENDENQKLGFVCERANNIEEDEYLLERVPIETGELLFFEDKLNYTEAYDVCQSNNGILVTADTPQLLETIAKHAKKFHGAWLGATITSQSQKFLWTHIRKLVTEKIELITGELLNAKHRVKRFARDFRDEVLDKSEIEDELRDVYQSFDSDESDEEDDGDDDDLFESEESDGGKRLKIVDDNYNEKERNNFKRSVRGNRDLYSESTTTVEDFKSTTYVPQDSSEEDEDITLPNDYKTLSQPISSKEYYNVFNTPSVDQPTNDFTKEIVEGETSIRSNVEDISAAPNITSDPISETKITKIPISEVQTIKITEGVNVQDDLTTNAREIKAQEFTPIAEEETTEEETTAEGTTEQETTEDGKTEEETTKEETTEGGINEKETTGEGTLEEETTKEETTKEETTEVGINEKETTEEEITDQLFSTNLKTENYDTTEENYSNTQETEENVSHSFASENTSESQSEPDITENASETTDVINKITTQKVTTTHNTSPVLEKLTDKIVNDLLKNLIYCLKIDADGKLIALNCSSRQSFVCEIRNNRTKKVMVQKFSSGNIDYAISNEQLSWKKAYKKCNRTFGGYLAIFNSIDELNFVNTISKDFQDLWIGAKYFDTWMWPYIDQSLPQNESLWTTPARQYKCANVYRQHSLELSLVDRNCTEKHGFICKDVKPRIVEMEMVGNYTIHWKPADFFEALSTCAQHDTLLVSAHDKEQVLNIINLRKGLHSFWISALFLNDNWIWLNNNTRFKKSEFNQEYLPGRECMSIFKHNQSSYSLIDRDCTTRLPFVCRNVNNRTIIFNKKSYTFYLTKNSWWEANNYCASRGQQLAIIKEDEPAALIQTVSLLFGDVWVDGMWKNESKWIWDFTGEIIYENPLLHYTVRKPSQRMLNVTTDVCLYAHNFIKNPGLLSYTLCSVPKGFVCQGVSTNDVPSVQSIKINNRTYTIHSRLVTWKEAQEICISNGTYLTVIDTANEISALSNFQLNAFWVGGRLENDGLWIWDHTGEKIKTEMLPKIKNRIKGPFKDCLSFYRDENSSEFVNVKCDLRLPFVCEEVGHNSKPQTRRIDFENEYLVLHNLRLTWDEANDMCVSAGQHLASITEDNVKHFFNLPSEYHDLWVDGKNEDDIWMWTELDTEITTAYIVRQNNTNIFTNFFIRNSPRSNHDCLNLYRPTFNIFAFLDSQCDDKFGFICQGTKFMQNQIKTVILEGRVYSIYTKKSTWYQANNICKANGTYLAVLNSTAEIELLTHNHLSFVKLWTGAVNQQGKWIWDHTGTEIGSNIYTQSLNTTLNQCGIIKKSNKGNVGLLPKNCSLTYAFVCEERGDQGKWTSKVLNISGHYYSVYSERATWTRAADMCADNGQYLALIDTVEEIEVVGQLDIDFHDLWVGGRRVENSNKWIWIHTGQEFLSIETQHDYSKLINKTIRNRCLNIYREWNSDALFIDRDCNEQHGYICESVPISKQRPQVLRTAFEGHKYLLVQQPLTWLQAYQACDKYNGYLAVINSQAEANFLSGSNEAFHDLWIGGYKRNNSAWKWYYTGQRIENDVNWERKSARENHNCLNLYNPDGQTGTFMDRQCTERHSFICEETTQYKEIKESDYLNSNDVDSFEKLVLGDSLLPINFLPYYLEFRGRKYMFSSVRVNFKSAVDSCRLNSGFLAILEDQAEIEFIGNNTEGYHNLWVDGKHVGNKWIWEHLGTTIPPDKFIDYNGRPNHDCLTFYRHDNITSYFVDRKCEEKHSFVCKEVIEESREVQEEFTYNNRYYLLLPNTQVTWFEAEKICKEESGYLAIADDTKEAEFLASLGNNLWIDAKFEGNVNAWKWNHIGQEIKFENYNVTKYTHAIDGINKRSKCLNLFRSFNDAPGFVERDCNDNFGFICEDLIASSLTSNISVDYKERKYLFVVKPMAWQDAYDTCRKNGSYLAIISTQEEGKFIAKMANDFHDMWVDGIYVENAWISGYTGQGIEATYAFTEENGNANADLIEWTSSEKHSGFDCLNSYLPSSNDLFFVGRNCSEKHTFVCEEVVNKSVLPETITYNGIRYTINMELVSWEEANKRCRKHGYLAIIDTIEEASALVKSSGKLHSLWIGAKYSKEDWIWNYTGEIIEPDVNLWVNVAPRKKFNCSILYRDNFMVPFIVDQSCDDKFGYICEEGETWYDSEPSKIVRYDGKMYTFHENRLSWDDAKKHCESTRSTLAVVETRELAALLSQQKEFYDFWIDGVSESLLWLWSSTGIYLQRFEDSVIKYVRIIPKMDPSCLGLFRSNNTMRYLDDNCNITKPFLCQKYDFLLSGNVTAVTRNATKYYLVNGVKRTWVEAWDICAANGSFLPIIKNTATADFVSSLYPHGLGEVWLGARKFSNWWTWELTEETLLESETEADFPIWSHLNQPDNMCLGLDHSTTMYPVFADLNCSASKVVICEQGCPVLPNVNGTWSRKDCTFRVQKVGEQCNLKCKYGYLLAGVPNITCTSNSWSNNIPLCLSVHDFSLSIVSNVEDALNSFKQKSITKKNIGLLFLIDTSSGVGWENYQSMLEVVKSISVGVKAFERNIWQSVISFEAEARIEFGFGQIDACNFIQQVDNLAYRPSSDVVSFEKAFEATQNVLESANASGSSVVFVIASNNSTENLSYDSFNIKQNGNIVIVVGIKPQVNVDFIEQLASPDSLKYQWNFDNFELNEVAYVLNRTFLYSGKLSCCMRLKNTNGLNVSPTSCTRDVSRKNARCSIQCNSQYHLQGIESLLCTSDGWQSTLDLKRPFPECYTTQQVTLSFLLTLEKLYGRDIVDSTLYLIDQSGSMSEDDFYTEVKFVKQLLRIGKRGAGVIAFSSEAYVEIPLANYEEPESLCALYDHLDSLRFSGGSTNYEKAFNMAFSEIQSFMKNCTNCSQQQRTLIVMLTDGQNSDMIASAEKLKSQGHIIVALSIAVNKRRNLIKVVSNSENNSPLLFSLNTFGDLQRMHSYINSKLLKNSTVICCRIPFEFQRAQRKMFVLQNEDLDVTCPPGYALSVENSTIKCTEIGLNVNPTCFAVPKKIAEYVSVQFYHVLDHLKHHQKQLIVFLIDQTDTMTLEKNNQALTFVKSVATLLELSENRTVGLINGQNHEAVMLIEPNVTSSDEFSRLLTDVTFNSTTYSYSLYKPLKYIVENMMTDNRSVLTVIISDRVYISTPSLKLAHKILSSNNDNMYIMEIHNETTESNIAQLVRDRHDFFISGYYMLKDNLYTIDSFETLEAVAESIYLV